MGYKYNLQAPALGVAVVMMFAVAHAQLLPLPLPPLLPLPLPPLLPGLPTLLNFSGILNCPSGPGAGLGIPGVTVRLNCTILGANVTLGQGVTNATGGFNISVSVTNIFSILPIIGGSLLPSCRIVAQLPLLNQTVCPILSTATGIVSAVPRLVSVVITPIQRILNFLTGVFVILSFNVGLGG